MRSGTWSIWMDCSAVSAVTRTFWRDLVREAHELGLTRPSYYALRYSRRLLDTPVPREVVDEVAAWAPARPVRLLMDALVERALPAEFSPASSAATLALYVRSHWLRMPPLMLVRHLARQSVRRRRT